MGRITFSMPPVTIAITALFIVMLLCGLNIIDFLRFKQCGAWVELPRIPVKDPELAGTLNNLPYVRSSNSSLYCLKEGQWKICSSPAWGLKPDRAPAWLAQYFYKDEKISQWIRGDKPVDVNYFRLLEDGRFYTCKTNLQNEADQILLSGSVLWLFPPAMIGILCVVKFFQLFFEYGDPTMWDWSGKGTKIK